MPLPRHRLLRLNPGFKIEKTGALCVSLACVIAVMALAKSLRGGAAAGPIDTVKILEVGDQDRTYLLHVPAKYDGEKLAPLVIVLHGGAGNASGTAKMTNFTAKADLEGFVVVYPYGTGRFRNRLLTWNSGNCCAYAMDHDVDDVGFIRALIVRLESDLKIDPRRIYVTGLSNGGMMAYRLGCELSDRIAAIAPVAGALNYEGCHPAQPLSVVIFHGTADPFVPYNGGEPKQKFDTHPRADKPVSYAVSYWVKNNNCLPQAKRLEKGSVTMDRYNGCKNGTEVVLYTIKGEGHTWPGGRKWAFWAAEPTHEVSATDAMWEFFAAHPKP